MSKPDGARDEWDRPRSDGTHPNSNHCSHAGMQPHDHTGNDGTTVQRAHCPSCGMEWG